MTITAQNLNDFKVKKLSFSFRDTHFQHLKIVRMAAGNQWNAPVSHFPENHFVIDFATPKKEGETFNLKVIAYYFQPFRFVPYKLRVNEEQRIEYSDHFLNLLFDDSVTVEYLSGKYLTPPQVHSVTREMVLNDLRNSNGGKEFVLKEVIPPFEQKVFRVHYTHDRPFELLTTASKSVDVSMWGNLKMDYDFRIVNRAAQLEGELSNVDYMPHMSHAGRTSMRHNRVVLSRDIWRLHLSDEVGNLTRSVASYLNADEIELMIVPRFSLFGGWKHTYWISYNQKADGHLSRSQQQPSLFRLQTSFGHILGKVLTEHYTLSFCLPEFAQLQHFDCPYPIKNQRVTKSFGLFEYFGKDCYTYEFDNVIDRIHSAQVSVYFDYNISRIYFKLIYVVLLVMLIFSLIFIVSRVDLSFEVPVKLKTD